MPGDFDGRISELIAMQEGVLIEGTIEVDQVYAHRQHEDMMYKHPHGGEAKFLEKALLERIGTGVAYMAGLVLEPGGTVMGMIEIVNDVTDSAQKKTPVWGDTLRRSYHKTVSVDGAVVYDIPAEVPRLTQAELEEKHDLLGPD